MLRVLNVTAGEYARLQLVAPATAPILDGRLVPIVSLIPIGRSLALSVGELSDSTLMLRVRRDVVRIGDDERITEVR